MEVNIMPYQICPKQESHSEYPNQQPNTIDVLMYQTDFYENDFSDNDTATTFFAETPIMSTYLVAFVVSDFQFMFNISDSNAFRQRIFSKSADLADTRFALRTGERILNAIKSYLGVNNTLPKIDHVVIPGIQHGIGGTIVFRKLIFFISDHFVHFKLTKFSHSFYHSYAELGYV